MEHSTHGSGAGSAGAEPRALRGRTERGRTQRACAAVCRTRVRNARARAARQAPVLRARFYRTQRAEKPPAAPPWAAAERVGVCQVSSAPTHSSVGSTNPAAGVEFLHCHCCPTPATSFRLSGGHPPTRTSPAPRWKWAAPLQRGFVQPESGVLLGSRISGLYFAVSRGAVFLSLGPTSEAVSPGP